jgi:hypothetical protein
MNDEAFIYIYPIISCTQESIVARTAEFIP